MQTEIKQLVTKDMVIGDVLKKYPDVAVIMLEHGLHCVGCHANVFDTIEAGCQIHGLDEATVDNMVAEINKFIAEEENKVKEVPSGPVKVSVTDVAAKKIKELLARDKLEGYGLHLPPPTSHPCIEVRLILTLSSPTKHTSNAYTKLEY